MFFHSWDDLTRVVVMGLCAYIYLIALLRLTGKRTLSKLNAFDLVVTIASGSVFAATLLDEKVSLSEGALAFLMLFAMQCAVAWTSARSERAERLVKSEPTVLLRRGQLQRDAMRAARVSEAEVLAACRAAGVLRLGAVEAVVLETAGDFSVLQTPEHPVPDDESALRFASRAS